MAEVGLERRLADLESRQAVADLIHRYATNVATGHEADNAGLFAEDGRFTVCDFDPLNPAEVRTTRDLVGRSALASFFTDSETAGLAIFPMIHNLIVTVDGDRAEATSLMRNVILPGGHGTTGIYRDTFVRREDVWRFATRLYSYVRQAGPGG